MMTISCIAECGLQEGNPRGGEVHRLVRAGGQRQRPGGGLDSAVRGGGQADSGNVTRKWNRYQPDSLTKHATHASQNRI